MHDQEHRDNCYSNANDNYYWIRSEVQKKKQALKVYCKSIGMQVLFFWLEKLICTSGTSFPLNSEQNIGKLNIPAFGKKVLENKTSVSVWNIQIQHFFFF